MQYSTVLAVFFVFLFSLTLSPAGAFVWRAVTIMLKGDEIALEKHSPIQVDLGLLFFVVEGKSQTVLVINRAAFPTRAPSSPCGDLGAAPPETCVTSSLINSHDGGSGTSRSVDSVTHSTHARAAVRLIERVAAHRTNRKNINTRCSLSLTHGAS